MELKISLDNLDNPTALTKNKSSAYETCVSNGGLAPTFASCKAILADNPESASGVYDIKPSGSNSFKVYCDMTTDGGGWTLVGITNSSAVIASVDNTFNVTDNYTGSYVKRLTGLTGTDQMLDCGTSDQGAKGVIILNQGGWSWPANSTLQVTQF